MKDGQTSYPISIRSEEQPHLANIGDGLEHTRGMFTDCLAIILEPAFSLINDTGKLFILRKSIQVKNAYLTKRRMSLFCILSAKISAVFL